VEEQPDTWLAAIRGLQDNPLVVYLRQAEQRRLARAGWFRRSLFFILVLALELLIVSLLGFKYASEHQGEIWAAFSDRDFLLSSTAIIVLPAYIVWACQGLFQAVVDALLVLAPPSRRAHHLALDDLSSITLLGDREIVAGALAVLFPPLILRQVVGSVLLCAGIYIYTYNIQPDPRSISIYTALALGPVALCALVLSGALGLVALLLFLLALSRDMRPVLASAGAMILVIAQLQYGALGISLAFGRTGMMESFTPWTEALSMLVVAIIVIWLLYYAMQAGQAYRAMRYILAVGAPLLAIFLPVLIVIPIGIYTDFDDTPMKYLMLGVIDYFTSLGALSVINPLAIPSPINWATPLAEAQHSAWPEWLRFPLLLLLQSGLIALFAYYAAESVRRRRQAE
jgi:hypothetical protein